MEPEVGDPIKGLREARRRIVEHPGYREYLELDGLARSLAYVFRPNLSQLLAFLDAAARDERLAIELVQNVREPKVREQFNGEVNRHLHNYVASAQSLVDHTRRLMRGRTGPIPDEFERRKAAVVAEPEVPLVVGLRHFTLHRSLPFVGHTLSFTNVNTPEQEVESVVTLSVAELLEWNRWSKGDRAFLETHGGALPLRPIIGRHAELVGNLNTWLYNALADANEDALAAVNELGIQANMIMTGGDRELAERRARRDFS